MPVCASQHWLAVFILTLGICGNFRTSSMTPNATMCKISRFEKHFSGTSELERSKTVRKVPANAPKQRTYLTYNISEAQHQRITEKKVRAILQCYFYVPTHGSNLYYLLARRRRKFFTSIYPIFQILWNFDDFTSIYPRIYASKPL